MAGKFIDPPEYPSGIVPEFVPDVDQIIWHYTHGQRPYWETIPEDDNTRLIWRQWDQRRVIFMDKIRFPKSQKRYIFDDSVTVKYDTCFTACLHTCATQTRLRRNWITKEVQEGFLKLFRLGMAHSFESWRGNTLIGGSIGLQFGGYITSETWFHLEDHGGKPASGQVLLRLKERGFLFQDVVRDHGPSRDYGEEWITQDRLLELINQEKVKDYSLI